MASTALRVRRALYLSSIISTRSITTATFYRPPFASPSPTTSATSNPKFGSRSIHTTSLSLSASRSFNQGNADQIDENTILFEGCDYNHWLITMDFPKDPRPPAEEMVETYVQTLAKVLGSVEEAKKRMYACSTTTYQGFQAVMDEETSKKFEKLPGVVFVLPDSYIDPVNKEYGGDKYDNGTIYPRPPPVQYGRPRRPRDQQNYPPRDNHSHVQNYPPRDNNSPGQNYPPRNNHGPAQNYPPQDNLGPGQNFQPRDNHGPGQNYPPRDNHSPGQNYPPRDNHGPGQNYPPRDNHSPGQNYPPRDNRGPALNYPPRDNLGPAQNYPPRDNLGPAQNFPPRDNLGPVQNFPPRDNSGPLQNYSPRDNHGSAQNYPPRDNYGQPRNYPPQQNYAPQQNYPPQQSYAPPQQNLTQPRQGERMEPPPQYNQGSYNQGGGYTMRNQSNQNFTTPSPSGGAQYGQGGPESNGQNQAGYEHGNGPRGEGANSAFGQGFKENGENRQFTHTHDQLNGNGQNPPINSPPTGRILRD